MFPARYGLDLYMCVCVCIYIYISLKLISVFKQTNALSWCGWNGEDILILGLGGGGVVEFAVCFRCVWLYFTSLSCLLVSIVL